jgi:hypothetical protein
LAKKIGVKPGHRLALLAAPRGWTIPDLPPDVTTARRLTTAGADVVVTFCRDAARLADGLHAWGDAVFPDGMVWVAWPRKAAGHVSDVDENLIRASALAIGLVDVKVAALDEDWSGLKLVWRKENRGR